MKAEVKLRIEEAEKLIREAEEALKSGSYDTCCVSSCYAMFHVVRALIISMDMNPKTLEDAVHLICLSREKIGFTKDDCSKIYRALDIKSEIDGGYLRRITEDVAKRTLDDAKEVLKKAKNFLRT